MDPDKAAERERWSGRTTFLLAAIGSAVGLGNLWRFPYLSYKHGGGAFMVPYLLSLFVLGIPILLLELGLGQIFQGGHARVMSCIHPRLRGVGLASSIMALFVAAYYTVLIGISLVFFLSGFTRKLPWSGGGEDAETFFYDEVLELSGEVGRVTKLAWRVENAALLVWAFLFFATRTGVKSAGWVVWVTVPMPVLLIVAILIHGLSKDGAADGIEMYMGRWDMDALQDPSMWQEAAGQVFFSIGVSLGTMSAYSSWTPRASRTLVADNFIIAITNSAISIVAGFAVYSVLGAMAQKQGTAVADVAESGPGLVYVTYPQGLAALPGAHVWCAVFFITLFSLGIDSAMSLLESLSCAVHDSALGRWMSRQWIQAALCSLGFVLSLAFCTDAGLYYLDLVDYYLSAYAMLLLGALECYAVGWVFQYDRAEETIGRLPLRIWVLSFLSASVLLIGLVVGLAEHFPNTYSPVGWQECTFGFGAFLLVLVVGGIVSRKVYHDYHLKPGDEGVWASTVFFYGSGDFARLIRESISFEGELGDDFTNGMQSYPGSLGWALWAVLIKYVVPVILLLLVSLGIRTDTRVAYNGYPVTYQWVAMFPLVVLLLTVAIPLFLPRITMASVLRACGVPVSDPRSDEDEHMSSNPEDCREDQVALNKGPPSVDDDKSIQSQSTMFNGVGIMDTPGAGSSNPMYQPPRGASPPLQYPSPIPSLSTLTTKLHELQ